MAIPSRQDYIPPRIFSEHQPSGTVWWQFKIWQPHSLKRKHVHLFWQQGTDVVHRTPPTKRQRRGLPPSCDEFEGHGGPDALYKDPADMLTKLQEIRDFKRTRAFVLASRKTLEGEQMADCEEYEYDYGTRCYRVDRDALGNVTKYHEAVYEFP